MVDIDIAYAAGAHAPIHQTSRIRRTFREQVSEVSVHRFYWLDEEALAGCSRPGMRDEDAADEESAETLEADLLTLRAEGIGALVTLTEEPLPAADVERHGFVVLHLPVEDYHAPAEEQFVAALAFITEQQETGVAVAVHCRAGVGRTGSILAATRIAQGMTAQEAINAVRVHCPTAVETDEQVEALERLALELPWLDLGAE